MQLNTSQPALFFEALKTDSTTHEITIIVHTYIYNGHRLLSLLLLLHDDRITLSRRHSIYLIYLYIFINITHDPSGDRAINRRSCLIIKLI